MSTIKELRKKLIQNLCACSDNIQKKEDIEIKVDFFISSIFGELSLHPSDYIWRWFLEKRSKSDLKTDIIPINKTEGWILDKETGNIHHRSDKFFSVKGIKVSSKQREAGSWCQPIIDQPEVGILGFLVKKIKGIYHFLVQAKEEPGNIEKVQLTTTLMATRSNLEQVHGGKAPLFLDYFRNPANRRVLVNRLQSEEGARFYKKNNLNMVVELCEDEEFDIPEMFMWMSLCQIKELLARENIINACARSVIACLP